MWGEKRPEKMSLISPLPISQLCSNSPVSQHVTLVFTPSQPFLQGFALMLQLGMRKAPALRLIQPGRCGMRCEIFLLSSLSLPFQALKTPCFMHSPNPGRAFLTSLRVMLIPKPFFHAGIFRRSFPSTFPTQSISPHLTWPTLSTPSPHHRAAVCPSP